MNDSNEENISPGDISGISSIIHSPLGINAAAIGASPPRDGDPAPIGPFLYWRQQMLENAGARSSTPNEENYNRLIEGEELLLNPRGRNRARRVSPPRDPRIRALQPRRRPPTPHPAAPGQIRVQIGNRRQGPANPNFEPLGNGRRVPLAEIQPRRVPFAEIQPRRMPRGQIRNDRYQPYTPQRRFRNNPRQQVPVRPMQMPRFFFQGPPPMRPPMPTYGPPMNHGFFGPPPPMRPALPPSMPFPPMYGPPPMPYPLLSFPVPPPSMPPPFPPMHGLGPPPPYSGPPTSWPPPYQG